MEVSPGTANELTMLLFQKKNGSVVVLQEHGASLMVVTFLRSRWYPPVRGRLIVDRHRAITYRYFGIYCSKKCAPGSNDDCSNLDQNAPTHTPHQNRFTSQIFADKAII